MLPTSKADVVWKVALSLLPLSAIALHASESLAQASIPEATTICAYNPDSGVPNVLGMRTYITAGQVGNDTVFVYEQFSSPVLNENDSSILTDVKSRRTLTLYGRPIAEARQILANSPRSYAALLGIEQAPASGLSFAEVNNTLACQDVSADNVANAPMPGAEVPTPAAPTPAAPPTPDSPTPAPQTLFADLPNGNYRLASATYPPRVVNDAELVENGGVLFLFRKFGEEITGRFSYIDSDLGACVTGTIEGNEVTGQAYTGSDGTYPEGSAATFLGPGGYLQLGENKENTPRAGVRQYESAVLNLETFSRINAGSVLPPESCP
ncbi:MAG: hypothetical protein WA947_17490 [Phormidesmis sp.]